MLYSGRYAGQEYAGVRIGKRVIKVISSIRTVLSHLANHSILGGRGNKTQLGHGTDKFEITGGSKRTILPHKTDKTVL